MSDLHIALILLGAFIIAGVVVYNWLQEKKLRENITDEFLVPQKDILAEDFYIDPDAFVDRTLSEAHYKSKAEEKPDRLEPTPALEADNFNKKTFTEPAQAVPEVIDPVEEIKTVIEEPAPPEPVISALADNKKALEEVQAEDIALPSALHPQIDLTAILYVTKSISAKTLNTFTDNIASDMGVPIMVHGLNKEDKWDVVNQKTASGSYKQIACSIQLADRSGPIPKHMLNKFQYSIENMGLEIGAHVEWQGSGDALQRAIELDKFCMEVDQIVSVHLAQMENPVHGTKFKGLAEANGLVLANDGKFHFDGTGDSASPLFTLSNIDQNQYFTAAGLRNEVIKGATFQIEIPKVANCETVFNQMIAIAQKMANSIGARMVDDNQKPLGDLQIEKIRQQLKMIHATMVARGVLPGSADSARLFN